MADPIVSATIAAAALAGLIVIALAGLKAWREWLELQHFALGNRPLADPRPGGSPGARIELADLKERVRKLEAIAAGVDF